MAVIKAPNRDYQGGIADVIFRDGVAETDNPAVIAYCRDAGYEVDGETANPAEPVPAFEGNSFKTHEQLATPLRDAAVDPRPGDFLPPVNAGQADPHGPEVVAPEIHASPGPTPIVPGPVLDDPVAQAARETESAARVLVDQEPVGDVVQALAAEQGPEQPPGNASQDAWADWVLATHTDLDEQTVRAMKRDELRDQYGS